MKQPDGKDANERIAPPQPVSILRRSSTGASKHSGPIDSEHDASDRIMSNSNSFHGIDANNDRVSPGSNIAPCMDANELADRLLNFNKSASTAGNNDSSGNQTQHNMRGHRPPPPPPPPRPSSSGKQRVEVISPSAKGQEQRHNSDSGSWCDATEEEYVRRMARIKLDQSDSTQGTASSELQNREKMNNKSAHSFTPPPKNQPHPSSTKNDEFKLNFNESSMSVNSNKFNSSSMSVNSNKSSSFTPRPVRVSQFEDTWAANLNHNEEPSTPISKPKTTMTFSISSPVTAPSSVSSAPHSVVVLSSPQNTDKRGRCKLHPQHKLYKKKLLGGYEFISNCPVCVATLRGRNQTRSGDYNPASAKSSSAKTSGRSSSSRERERSKSADRMPVVPSLEEDDGNNDFYTSKRPHSSGPGRMRRRAKSAEQQRHLSSSRERRRRTRSRDMDRDLDLHASNSSSDKLPRAPSRERRRRTQTRSREKDRDLHASNSSCNSSSLGKSLNALESFRDKLPRAPSRGTRRRTRTRSPDNRGKSQANSLENIHDKLSTHTPPSVSSREGNSRRRRSRSREERRSPDEEFIRGTMLMKGWSPSTKNLEKGLRELEKGKRGDRTPKMSLSYDETTNRKTKNLGSNPFVRQTDDVNFDKKTGRCKKHPSIILAKKSTFRSGSWEIIKKNGCPFCAEAMVDSVLNEVEQYFDEDTKTKMERLLKGGRDNSGEGSSSSQPPRRSRKVDARKTSSSRGGNSTPSNEHIIESIPPEGVQGRKVSKLPYTTPIGEAGWYTGEVDSEGIPHGYGRMRFRTGHSYEGEWNHGYSETHMDNLNRIKSGFGSNKAAWNQSGSAPSVRKAAASSKVGGVKSPDSAYYQQQSSHQGYSPAQIQQAQLQQVQMQQWASMSPQERQIAMTQWYASNGISPQSGYQMQQGYPPL